MPCVLALASPLSALVLSVPHWLAPSLSLTSLLCLSPQFLPAASPHTRSCFAPYHVPFLFPSISHFFFSSSILLIPSSNCSVCSTVNHFLPWAVLTDAHSYFISWCIGVKFILQSTAQESYSPETSWYNLTLVNVNLVYHMYLTHQCSHPKARYAGGRWLFM